MINDVRVVIILVNSLYYLTHTTKMNYLDITCILYDVDYLLDPFRVRVFTYVNVFVWTITGYLNIDFVSARIKFG